MKIKDVDTENMSNDEINSLIKRLYQSKSENPGGGAHSKISIRTLSSLEESFDKKGKYYEYLKIPLFNNMNNGDYYTFLQKNNTNSSDSMEWYRGTSENDYDYIINYGFRWNRKYIDKSFIMENGGSGYNMFNVFIINYDE